MIISGAHEESSPQPASISGSALEAYQFHFARNIPAKAPAKYQAGLSSELTEMFSCGAIGEVRKKRNQILADYKDIALRQPMLCLDEGFERP